MIAKKVEFLSLLFQSTCTIKIYDRNFFLEEHFMGPQSNGRTPSLATNY